MADETLAERLAAGEARALRIIETLDRLRAKRQEVVNRRMSAALDALVRETEALGLYEWQQPNVRRLVGTPCQ